MNNSKNILIQDGTIKFYFRYLEWDSKFFSKPSYLLDIQESNLSVSDLCKTIINEKLNNKFVTVKLNTKLDNGLLNFFQECGFYYVDTEVVLEYVKKGKNLDTINKITILKKDKNSGLPYQKLGSTFSLTRFHSDLNISNLKADTLWINYLKNYAISESRQMFTSEVDGAVVGVILVNVNNSVATLFYVSVINEYKGLGIGSSLIEYVLEYFKKA